MAKLIDNNPIAHTINMWARTLPDSNLMCVCQNPEGGVVGVFAQLVVDEAAVAMCNSFLPKVNENDIVSSGYLFSTIRTAQLVKNDEGDFDGVDWNKATTHLCGECDAYISPWRGGLPDFVTKAFLEGMDAFRLKLLTEYSA